LSDYYLLILKGFQTSQIQQQELLPTTYFVKTAGEDLRITRWFRHQ